MSTPPLTTTDAWVRHFAGHRRLSEALLADVAAHAAPYETPDGWITRLLSRRQAPISGATYTVVDGGRDLPGTLCWRLTDFGFTEVEKWIENDDYHLRICDVHGAGHLVLVLLYGAGCGIPRDHVLYSPSARLERFAEQVQVGHRAGQLVISPNAGSMQTRDLIDRITAIQATDEAWRLGAPFEPLSMRDAMPIMRWLRVQHGDRPALIEATRRGQVREGLGRFGILEAPAWVPVRAAVQQSTAISERSRELLAAVSSRSSTYKSVAPPAPLSRAMQSQLEDVKRTQQIIGQVLRAHPGGIAMHASGWSIHPFPVYAEQHHYRGWPCGLDVISALGPDHPMVRMTTRIVDGVVWLSHDAPLEPSVWIEFEGGPTNSRVGDHVMAALAMSSRWAQRITLIIATSPQAKRRVINDVSRLVLDEIVTRHSADWPGAEVDVRVLPFSATGGQCPLHTPPMFQRVLTAPGSPLKFRRQP